MIEQQNQVNIGGKAFTIIKQIGQGTQGAVYKGQGQQGEEVAIKYQNTISNTEYEILQNLAQNPKPNIIGIQGVQRDITGKTVIVMELANEELYQFMTNNPEFRTLSKDQKSQIFNQMVQAVKELHELGYFHRDLKPENFVVFKKDANGFIKTKLIDLGLCKQQKNLNNQITKNVGTPYYMAPEIFNGSLLYDHSVDSWALGCIWFELMTGQTFFVGNEQNALFLNIRQTTQQQIDQKIENQLIFNQQEKQLLKQLIQKVPNKRIQVQVLAQKLQANQNNNQINPNFNNNQIVNVFKTPIVQFPQYQNINQFNQPNNNFNVIQQNQNFIQPIQQQQQNQNQMNEWKQQQQQQMQQEYEQKLKKELEVKTKQEIDRVKKEEEEIQKQKLLDQQKILEQQNQLKLKEMEEEYRKKNEEEQKRIELDKQQLRELQIQQELKIQNDLEEQKKKFEEDQRKQQEELKKIADEKMQFELKQKEQELQTKIAAQLQQQYLIEYNQKFQQKQQQQRQEMEKLFIETKNKVKKLIKNSKEVIEKFIQSLEEKSQEKLISESQTIVSQKYKEFSDLTQNYVNQYKQKITKLEENENAIQQMDDYEQQSQINQLEQKLVESNQQIAQDQIDVWDKITQKYQELISQLMSQKQLKEQLENQKKQQINQLQQLQTQYQSYNQQIKELKSNLENQQKNSQQMISQVDDNQILISSKYINDNLQNTLQLAFQFEQQEKQFKNQEVSIQIMQYNQMNSQLFKIIEELKQLMNQQQQLSLKAENIFLNLKVQTNEKIQQFQDQAMNFKLCYQKYYRAQEILNQELTRLQTQGCSFLIQQKVKEIQELVIQMESEQKQFETNLTHLQQNFNQNMMIQCKQLVQDLNTKQNEFSILETKMIQLNQQLGRIKNQLNQIVIIQEENQKKLIQWDQSSQTLLTQILNFSQVNGVNEQLTKLKESFDSLKNELKSELEKLYSQKLENEEQLRKYIDDNQRITNDFMKKFEDKKSTAQNLLQNLLQFQLDQDEKLQLYNQFNVQCSQVKQMFKQLRFDNNFEIYAQIRNYSCEKQMQECLEYLKECQSKFNENSKIFHELNQELKGKNSFPITKTQVTQELIKLYNKSVQAINELNQFQEQYITPYYKGNFYLIEQGDDQQFEKLAKCKEIQDRVENLSFENSDQYQKTLNSQTNNQNFIDKIKKDIQELQIFSNDLQQMNIQGIEQFNQQITKKKNSWFIQMLLINLIKSFQKQNFIQRKSSKAEEKKGNQEQYQQLLDEQSKIKELMLKCQSYLDSKQYCELKVEELIETQRQIKESVEKDLIEIKTKNRVKLRGFIKDQAIIKEIVEMTQVQNYSQTIQAKNLKNE